jgi:hypothetical protein
MQLVSYRTQGHMDESWRAGVKHDGLVVDVTTHWHDNVHVTTTRHLLAAGPASLSQVFKQAREIFDAGPAAH